MNFEGSLVPTAFTKKSKDTLGWVDRPCLLHHISRLEINDHMSLSHRTNVTKNGFIPLEGAKSNSPICGTELV